MSHRAGDGWTTIAAAVGLTAIGLALCLTHTNHGLLELLIAALAGLGGFTAGRLSKGGAARD